MSARRTAPVIPNKCTCGQYTPGHDVHYIQYRLSRRELPIRETVIEAIADDGTITFVDGSTLWNHDPARLRAIVEAHSAHVELRTQGVLAVTNPTAGGSTYMVCVAGAATPCADGPAGPRPGESLLEELTRRGGVLRPGRQVLAELGLEADDE